MPSKGRDKVIYEDILRFLSLQIPFDRLEGRTVLVAGANGFLPSYLADTVAILNDEVFKTPCRLIAVTHSQVKPGDRLDHLLGRDDVEFMSADVEKGLEIPSGVDYMIHGASSASPKKYLAKPIETMDANVNGIRAMLDYSLHNKVESILFISSGSIYGEPPAQFTPTKEDFPGNVSCTSERSCYSEAKRYAETLCYQFNRKHGTPVKAVRPFHNFGPGQRLDDGRVIADFLADAFDKRPIEVRSAGDTLMTFLYVADCAEAFWRILLTGKDGEAYNIGSEGPEYSVLQIAKTVSGLFSPAIPVNVHPAAQRNYQTESPKRSRADVAKLKLLGWSQKYSLQEGLKRTIRWHEGQNKKTI